MINYERLLASHTHNAIDNSDKIQDVSNTFDRILCESPVELRLLLERYSVVATHKLSVEQHAAPDRLLL